MISSAKRGKNERQSLHAWHPYYAGYSESFVLSVINAEGLKADAVVLDPWMGSGTTGLVCQKQNIDCIGTDINPVMSRFAAAKSYSIIPELNSRGITIMDEIISEYEKNLFSLSKKIKTGQQVARHIKKLHESIGSYFYSNKNISDCKMNPLSSFYYSVLFYTSRVMLGINSGSNPTWIIDSKTKNKTIKRDFINEFKINFAQMLSQLNDYFYEVESTSTYTIYNSDCKSLPIDDNAIDIVITSPPYLTRIDYVASTRVELQLTYSKDEYEVIRRKSMGTTTVPKIADPLNEQWGNICKRILDQVMNHKSRASDTYYIKNKIRYFSDAFTSLVEIFRVLKKGSSAYLALQNSYYKEIEIPLYDIYCEMALNIGYSAVDIIHEEKVRVSLGQINPKSSVYVKDKIYYEKIIKVTK
ncbi:hypothetical protein DVQ18_09600 [Yersinia enterocolitica]|nr:DNA methyltransferase [Yersinia kristensenii]EKN3950953.1 hypothetical protein [Yersinia enterocolitica]EKN4139638.1 hypothetical protein [Yersinia enterocolitica]EKN5136403.1 hypothetical protein [Yersinia enterocolitica]EKN6104244.1 hypothetical protein [Yersinia enterocolitica]ELZ1904526.1 hypothetical protein [Yersinia enterocolitica]